MERWIGKLAIVTGAGGGIGGAICEALVKAGINVAGIDVRPENVDEIAKKFRQEKGKLSSFKVDLRKEDEINAAFENIREQMGPVHILVNCAGIYNPTNLVGGDPEIWRATLDVNVVALCVCTSKAIQIMQEENINGQIVHINSVAGHQVYDKPGVCLYNTSKFAVTTLAESLRLELNRSNSRIKITSVSPGVVDTPLFTNVVQDDITGGELDGAPALKPEAIANGIMYVLSTPEDVHVRELTIAPVNGL